jgi:2-alkyl-3-oxoalkanoate reductase
MSGKVMRIMVAGATGAVGVRLVPRLLTAEHVVGGLTRSRSKTDDLTRLGAAAFAADAFDSAAVRSAMLAFKPEIVIHEMTALRNASDLSRFDRAFALTYRLRTEGLDNLVAAALECGSRRLIAQSFCGWPYARTGGPVKTEEDPLDPSPPPQMRQTLEAIRHLESAVAAATMFEGVVLRYGAFYGPRSGLFDGPMVEQIRRRRMPLVGDANGWWSFVHLEDAVDATLCAVERGKPGLYNIVDDDPAPVSVWLPTLAAMLGARRPLRVPRWLGRIAAGDHVVAMMTENRAGSNLKARRDLGWTPAHPSWRQGFAEVLSAA